MNIHKLWWVNCKASFSNIHNDLQTGNMARLSFTEWKELSLISKCTFSVSVLLYPLTFNQICSAFKLPLGKIESCKVKYCCEVGLFQKDVVLIKFTGLPL